MDKENYLKQNDAGLETDIQKIGCFFRAALHMAEMQAKKNGIKNYKLNAAQINKLWKRCKALDYIDKNNDMKTSAACANLALRELGDAGRFSEIATFNKGTMYWYRGQERRCDYHIQKISQNGPSKTHFINVDKFGTLVWDPHTPDIKATGIFYTICYRYDEGPK